MSTSSRFVPALLVAAAIMFAAAPFVIATAPNEVTMGLVYRIFYFHVPSAVSMLTAAIVCGLASGAYLWRRRPGADRLALASAELSVLFGLMTLVTGPLWARKAWGVWWAWDPRLTSTLVMWMVFVAYLMLRRFGGQGSEALSAAIGFFGMALVPFVYYSVNFWRTMHPKTSVLPTLPAPMLGPMLWCLGAFALLFVSLLVTRVRLERDATALEEVFLALED